MARKAFVTGGTGFIGLNLIEQLTREGWKVTALHRPTSDLSYIQGFPVDLVEGSITDKSSLERAIPADTEVVFHLAGSTNAWSKRNAEQTAINVDGSRNMVEAAAKKGVQTFIHTSSISAWGRIDGEINETAPQMGADSWINYERTKWAGEKEALKGMEHGMKVVILNPGGVAGPYDANTWGRMFFLLRDGELPITPPGKTNFTHVQEVVKAHIAAVDQGRNGENYVLGGESCSFKDVIQEIAQLIDLSKIPPVAPPPVLKILSRILVFTANFTKKEPDITPEIAALMITKEARISSKKAIAELDYRILPWQTGFRDCHDWLVKEGKL